MYRTFATFFFLLAFALISTAHAADSKVNVLFLIADDLNCDLGTYGHPQVKSPHLDRLASRGVQFEKAYCQMPGCNPSRISFLTGLYPDQTLSYNNQIYLREHTPNVTTLPQAYRKAGYFPARVGKVFHYNNPSNIGTGGHDDPHSWDQTVNPRGRDKDDEDLIYALPDAHPMPPQWRVGDTLSWLAADGEDEEQTDGVGATEAIKLLERFASRDTPFFLAVGFYRPHLPFVAPKKYFDMYPIEDIKVPEVPEGYLDTVPPAIRSRFNYKYEEANISQSHARRAIQAYYATTTFMDAQVGRVLDALDSTGLAENTVVVFTSDHGFHLGEHGLWKKGTLFENAARVPLIFAGPGVKAKGSKTNSLAELVDLYPTLTELSGVQPPPYLSGVSLVPALVDPNATPRVSAITGGRGSYSIRTARYRYTRRGRGPGSAANSELYDHQSDPEEMVNLIRDPSQSDVVSTLSAMLDERARDARIPPEGVIQNTFEFERVTPDQARKKK